MRKWEGGDIDHPKDPGGLTSRGVTAARGAEYRRTMGLAPKAVTRWTNAEVDAFYKSEFWDAVRGDGLPAGVDLATFDFGVNSGVSRATRALQSVLGIKADGVVGHVTILAASKADGRDVVQKLCAKRLGFVKGLAIWSTFGKGWARRIADIEARGVAMWLQAAHDISNPDRSLTIEADAADAKSASQGKGAAATTSGGAGVGGVDALANGGPNWLLLGVIAALVAVTVVALISRSQRNAIRAEAYRAVAAG